jgi:DNA-binding CsgD family transcriptional regulator
MNGSDGARSDSVEDGRRVVGRSDDLDRIGSQLFEPAQLPTAVVIFGEAGIGKTTVWRALLEEARARRYRVLSTAGAEAEAQLSLAGARDLVAGGLDAVAQDLPAAQTRALRVLLLQEHPTGGGPDPGAMAAAFLSMLLALAARGPILVAADDIQWLDAASSAMLSHALRRLEGARVATLLAWRDPGDGSSPPVHHRSDRSSSIELGPLSFGAIISILRDQLPQQIPRSTLRRIHAASGGNPLFAIELARAWTASPIVTPAGGPLPVPPTLRELLRRRVSGLPPKTTDMLGLASALARPTISMLELATEADPRPMLEPALEAGVIEVDAGGLRFRHPLIEATVYELAPLAARRQMHRRLAEIVEDLEERARHLALGTDRADAAVAAELEEAARLAFLRGSPASAADLAGNAVRLTPDRPEEVEPLRRRQLAEVDYQFAAGDTRRASALLDDLLTGAAPGPERARLLARRARLHHFADDIRTSVRVLREALSEVGDDDELRATIEEGLAWDLMMIRSDLPAAAAHAGSAARLAEHNGNDASLAEALAAEALARCLTGQNWSAAMDRALELEPATLNLRVLRHPSFALAYILGCTDELDRATSVYEDLARRATQQGDESAMPSILNHRALIDMLRGRWDDAERSLGDGVERARESDQQPSLAALLGKRALLAAWRGDAGRARELAREALRIAGGSGSDRAWLPEAVARGGESAIWALADVELQEGDPNEACGWLAPLRETLMDAGVREPGEMRWLGDEIEALVVAGRQTEAEQRVGVLESLAERVGRRSAQAVAARGRALLDAARGNLDSERAGLDEAMQLFGALPMPFEQARTMLALGGHHRRRHAWREARATLTEAGDRFRALGAIGWAERAQRELDRVGGRPPAGDGLSPTEREVASLVAHGRTNREVAAALVLSVHTVEAALTRVYSKLGIRSRSELARRYADDPDSTIS